MTGDEIAALLDGPAASLAAAVRSGAARAAELVDGALARVAKSAAAHGTWLHVAEASARRAAAEVDRRTAAGEDLPLAGVPLAVKDNIDVSAMPTTAGSRILEGFHAPAGAACVERLQVAGCVVLGKTNCDEFGMGSSNENSAFGPVRNPWDPARVPGGSSGGSAAAVADLSASLAIGTDTGGSVRQPAALCGLVGWKPTYGRVSRYGLVAFASSFDQAGALARTVRDAALAFEAMAGADPRDATSLRTPVPRVVDGLEAGASGLRVGLLAEARSGGGLHPEVARSFDATAEALARAGAIVSEVSVPRVSFAVPVYYLTATAEASSNLARFDGVRYGVRRGDGGSLAALYRRTRTEGFGPEVKRRILLGTFALSAGYHDAYYGRAQRVRALLARDFARAFEEVDAILCPTSPEPAFPLGAKSEDPLAMYLADVFTVPPSLAGLPAVTVPSGFTAGGLPLGMQLVGPPDGEPGLFRLARALERGVDPRRAPGAVR